MVDKSIPWVRFLFTGYREHSNGAISHYCFTTVTYNPASKAKISDRNNIVVPREKLSAFLSVNSGAILGNPDFDDGKVRRFSCQRQDVSGNNYTRKGLELVFYFEEDSNNLWYVTSKGEVFVTLGFEEVYEKYQGILSGEVVLLESDLFSPNFKTVIEATEGMIERLKLIEGRSRITGQDLAKLRVSGYDSSEGEVLVEADGLIGESKTGVNVYPEVVSEVTVSEEDMITSLVKVFDLSRCSSLRNFEIGNARYARVAFNESISLIFSGSAQRMAYGSFYPKAKEVRVVGTRDVLFKEFISVDGHVTLDGDIYAERLTLKECTGLSTLKVYACHGEDGYYCHREDVGYTKSKIELARLDTEHLEVHNLQLSLEDELEISGCKDLKYLTLSFIELPEEAVPFNLTDFLSGYGSIRGFGLEGFERLTIDARYSGYCLSDGVITHFDTEFPNLVELTLIGILTNKLNKRLEFDCKLKVPKGCKVNCGDEELAREFIFHD